MHISHDFIATKTCLSYKFLVVFGEVRVSDRKSAKWGRVGMVAGWVRVRSARVRGGSGQICQPAQDSKLQTPPKGFACKFQGTL